MGRKVGGRVRRLRVVEGAAQSPKYDVEAAKWWVTRGPSPKNVGKNGKNILGKTFLS
jgi:hypothetical protein